MNNILYELLFHTLLLLLLLLLLELLLLLLLSLLLSLLLLSLPFLSSLSLFFFFYYFDSFQTHNRIISVQMHSVYLFICLSVCLSVCLSHNTSQVTNPTPSPRLTQLNKTKQHRPSLCCFSDVWMSWITRKKHFILYYIISSHFFLVDI